MAFFKRGNDDAKTAEQSEAEMNALVERLGASIEERIKPLREGVEKLQSDWDGIKADASRTPAVDTRPKNADGTPRELTDEEKNKQRGDATIALAVATNARLTEREVLDALPSDWQHLIPEIRAMFNDTPIQRKAQADYAEYCNNCADLAIARAARKAGLRYNRENQSFFLEDKSAGSTETDSPLNDPSLAWHQQRGDGSMRTWGAAEQLRKLGIDPKEFEESVKKGVV